MFGRLRFDTAGSKAIWDRGSPCALVARVASGGKQRAVELDVSADDSCQGASSSTESNARREASIAEALP